MPTLSLSDHVHVKGEILDAVLTSDDHRAFVFTPNDPLPARRLAHNPARWEQDGPTFAKIKRVENWGWLRRQCQGFTNDALVHPAVGTAFHVCSWRHRPSNGNDNFSGPIFLAYLTDGRIFADQWASWHVLHDALGRWRNAQGYLVDWQTPTTGALAQLHDPPTCAIGGADWNSILSDRA